MLAIIIPYYKLTYFEETLQSLSNQTDKRFKVYIGDDASPEDCTGLLNKFKGQFNFEYKRFDNNLGRTSLTKQWDRCIALSNEEDWIMILGDDDFLSNSLVENWYKNYSIFSNESNVIRYANILIDENNIEISNKFNHPKWEVATDSFYRKFIGQTRSSLSEYVFSKEAYVRKGFYDYKLAWNSDDRAWLDFSENKPIFTINESTVYVRISKINITGRKDNLVLKNESLLEFYKFLISQKLSYYTGEQRLNILNNYCRKILLYRKITFQEYIYIAFYCIKYFNFGMLKKGFQVISKKI